MEKQKEIEEYILSNYVPIEAIFLEDLEWEEEELKFLLEKGVVKEYQKGVYVRPANSKFLKDKVFINQTRAAVRTFIKSKQGEIFGFYTGYSLLNNWGLTTQVPSYLIIKTNNFPKDAKEGEPYNYLGNIRVILYKADKEITNENWKEEQYKELTKFINKEEVKKERKYLKSALRYHLTEEEEETYYKKYIENEE